jgi:uncharacterized protein (TIGR02757 family)
LNKKQFLHLKALLNEKADQYNRPFFIESDPIAVPHRFSQKQDIEIAGFFAAIFSWGQRPTIIAKSMDLMERMDFSPYTFIKDHQEADLKSLLGFKHRTFQELDLLWLVEKLQRHYREHISLEAAFLRNGKGVFYEPYLALKGFHDYLFDDPFAPSRTRKHVATPERKSTCKRINMFLRWMVRKDERGVDFGIWDQIPQSQLICPFDLHVERVARALGLIKRKQGDWLTALELTEQLKAFDADDPVKYDFALFGLGVFEKYPLLAP